MKNLGINFYHFLPTHLSTILLRKHGPISKSISKRYCQVVVLFSRLFCLVLVSIDYNIELAFIPSYTPEMNPIEQVWKEIRKRGFKNKAFQTLESLVDKLQEVIQGLEKSILKSTVSRQWTRLFFENN